MADSLPGMHKALGLFPSFVKVERASTRVEIRGQLSGFNSHLPPCQGRVSLVFVAVLCTPGLPVNEFLV